MDAGVDVNGCVVTRCWGDPAMEMVPVLVPRGENCPVLVMASDAASCTNNRG